LWAFPEHPVNFSVILPSEGNLYSILGKENTIPMSSFFFHVFYTLIFTFFLLFTIIYIKLFLFKFNYGFCLLIGHWLIQKDQIVLGKERNWGNYSKYMLVAIWQKTKG
jgi:hypothetical protein